MQTYPEEIWTFWMYHFYQLKNTPFFKPWLAPPEVQRVGLPNRRDFGSTWSLGNRLGPKRRCRRKQETY